MLIDNRIADCPKRVLNETVGNGIGLSTDRNHSATGVFRHCVVGELRTDMGVVYVRNRGDTAL